MALPVTPSLFARDLGSSFKKAQKKAKGDSFGKQLAKGIAAGLVTGFTTELGKQIIGNPAQAMADAAQAKERKFLETEELRNMKEVNNSVNTTMKTLSGIEDKVNQNLITREEGIATSSLVTKPLFKRLEKVMTQNGLNYAALTNAQKLAILRPERNELAKIIKPTYDRLLELGQNVRNLTEHEQFKKDAYNSQKGIINAVKNYANEKFTGINSIDKSIQNLQQDPMYKNSVAFQTAFKNYTADKDVDAMLAKVEQIDIKERIKKTPGLEIKKIEKMYSTIAGTTYPVNKITVENKALGTTTVETTVDKARAIPSFDNKQILKDSEKPSAIIKAFGFSDQAEKQLMKRLAQIKATNKVTNELEIYDYNNPQFFYDKDGIAAYQETINVIRAFGVNPANRKDVNELKAKYLSDHLQNQYRHTGVWNQIKPLFVPAPEDKTSSAYREWARKTVKANEAQAALNNAFQINNDLLVGIELGAIGLIDVSSTIEIPDDDGNMKKYDITTKRAAPVGTATFDGLDKNGQEQFTPIDGISKEAWEDSLNTYRKFNLDDLVGMNKEYYDQISRVITESR